MALGKGVMGKLNAGALLLDFSEHNLKLKKYRLEFVDGTHH